MSSNELQNLSNAVKALEKVIGFLDRVGTTGFEEARSLVSCADFVHDLWKQTAQRHVTMQKEFENVTSTQGQISESQGSN